VGIAVTLTCRPGLPLRFTTGLPDQIIVADVHTSKCQPGVPRLPAGARHTTVRPAPAPSETGPHPNCTASYPALATSAPQAEQWRTERRDPPVIVAANDSIRRRPESLGSGLAAERPGNPFPLGDDGRAAFVIVGGQGSWAGPVVMAAVHALISPGLRAGGPLVLPDRLDRELCLFMFVAEYAGSWAAELVPSW
jgi:hypothetical protein